MKRRLSSLRSRSWAVVLAVVIAPAAVVWGAGVYDRFEGDRNARRVERGARDAAARVGRGRAAPPSRAVFTGVVIDEMEAIALREGIRLRVVDARGHVLVDSDHDLALSLRDRLGDLFFGPDGAPTLRAWDDTLPAISDRPVVRQALSGLPSTGCARELGGQLLVCEAAIPAAGGEAAVLAQKASPRAIRAFADARYPLLKLTLYVLVVGLGLAAWLGRRIVRPIEKLRREVLERARSPGSASPLAARPGDEIGDLAEAFNTLLRTVEERGRANEAFAADLVHELKSPVAALRAAAESMATGTLDEARSKRLARVVDTAGRRLDLLVTRFLELARAEAGLAGEERAAFDAAELVRGLVDSLRDDERHAAIRFDVDASTARVEGVIPRVEAAIRSVLDNAASFAGEAGWVRVTVRRDGEACVIEVTDSGPGIPPDRLPRVFDRFFTERATGQGTGLGLALTKAIVEAHGGSVAASSPPSSGAIFTIRLPLA